MSKNLFRARQARNIRRIHKWENAIERFCFKTYRKKIGGHKFSYPSIQKLKKRLQRNLQLLDLQIKDFSWSWCPVCKVTMVICPLCKNNTCNASYGKVRPDKIEIERTDKLEDLIDCSICPTAHDVQDFLCRTGKAPAKNDLNSEMVANIEDRYEKAMAIDDVFPSANYISPDELMKLYEKS